MENKSLSQREEILTRITKRLNNEVQSGGSGVRSNQFSSSGSFGNVATQLVFFIENSMAGIVDGVKAVYSVVTLPMDLGHELGKPNEPLPDNTPIHRIIDVV